MQIKTEISIYVTFYKWMPIDYQNYLNFTDQTAGVSFKSILTKCKNFDCVWLQLCLYVWAESLYLGGITIYGQGIGVDV